MAVQGYVDIRHSSCDGLWGNGHRFLQAALWVKTMNIFDNLDDFVKVTGQKAKDLKDSFAREIVVKEPKDGVEKAAALLDADNFTLLIERHEGRYFYKVSINYGGESFVAFGPQVLQGFFRRNPMAMPSEGFFSSQPVAG